MAIGDEFTIDYTNKRIYHNSGSVTVYTVQALYSWLQDSFDEQAAMDDTVPMSAQTPTEYTMINNWYLDIGESSKAYQFLKGGAIKTDGYLSEIQVVTFGATYTNCVASDIGKQVQDDTVEVGPLLSYDNTAKKWWVRTGTGTAILNGSSMTITGGTGAGTTNADSVDGEDLYANIYTLGTIEATGLIYVSQAGAKIDPDWWDADEHIDVLIQVKEAGTEIDAGKITVYIRVYTDLFDFYEIDLTNGGRNAVPLASFDDPDNQTAVATVMAYMENIRVHFMNGELTYDTKTGDDPVAYKCLHGTVNHSTALLLDAGGGAATSGTFQLANVEGTTWADNEALEICSELAFDVQTALFTVGNTVEGVTSSATGVVRAVLQDPELEGDVGVLYLSDVSGTWQDNETVQKQGGGGGSATTNIPSGLITSTFDAQVAGASAFTHDNSITKDLDNGNGAQPYNIVIDLNSQSVAKLYEYVKALCRRVGTYLFYTSTGSAITKIEGYQYQRAVSTHALKKASPIGTFAGGKFFGAQGVWIEDMLGTDSESYSLIDANGTTQNPPVTATIKVVSMIATNDRLLTCESTGSGQTAIKRNQYTMTTQGSGVDYVCVSGAIADDAPSTGVVRVVYDYGLATEGEDIYSYTSIDRSGADDKFMISGVTARAYDSGDRAYNPYLDKNADASGEAEVSVKYSGSTKYIVTRVRYKGYIPFSVAGSFAAAGITVTAIRTVDGIYQP